MANIIITALLSGLFSGLVLFALNDRRDQLARQLEKTEEAILAFAEYCDALAAYCQIGFEALGTAVDSRALIKKNGEWSDRLNGMRERAQMLIAIYQPSHHATIDEVHALAVPAMGQIGEILKKATGEKRATLEEVQAASAIALRIIEAKKRGLADLYAAGRLISQRKPVHHYAVETTGRLKARLGRNPANRK